MISTVFCQAQQLVQTAKDIHVVCRKENEFLGRPLKALLQELKPAIKMVFAEGGWAEQAPHFSFFFMPKQGFDSCRRQGSLPLRLTVYVKDFFQWTYDNRGKEHYLAWTKDDEEKYGDLPIIAIRVAGACEPCEAQHNMIL